MILIIPIIGVALLIVGVIKFITAQKKGLSIKDLVTIVSCSMMGLIMALGGGISCLMVMNSVQDNVYSAYETAHVYRENINTSSINMLKSADTLLTFTDKETKTYKEATEAISDARKSGYSGTMIERVYVIIREIYPTDTTISEQCQTYIDSVETAHNEIITAQNDYNNAVSNYRSQFTPLNKVLFLIGEYDNSLEYYSID